MRSALPQVKLGKILTRYRDAIDIDDLEMYKRVTIRLRSNGIVIRDQLPGNEIETKRQFRIKTGQLLLSKIDARNGAFGIVPEDCNEAIITGNFWAFEPDTACLDVHYLYYLTKTSDFVGFCIRSSEGTTNRLYLQEDIFLNQEINLPPLDEQRRIVARIEALAGRVAEAQRLRVEAIKEGEALILAKEMEIWPNESLDDAPTLADVTQYLARGRQSKQGESEHYLIKTRHVQMGEYVRSDMMLDADIVEKVNAEACAQYGDILIACSAAGCLGRVAQFNIVDQVASTDTHVAIARANPEIVSAKYLYAYLRGAQGQYQLRSRERGDWQREKISFRLTELNMNDLQKVPIPLPAFEEQRRIVAYIDALHAKVAQVRHYQSATQAELDALLPAILDKAFRGEL